MKIATFLTAASISVLVGGAAAVAQDATAPTPAQLQGRTGTMGDMPAGVAAGGADMSASSAAGVGASPAWTGKAAGATNAAGAGVNSSALATDIPGLPNATPAGNPILYGSSPGTFQPGTTVGMAPIPDTRANRAQYGGPDSNGGKTTRPAGN